MREKVGEQRRSSNCQSSFQSSISFTHNPLSFCILLSAKSLFLLLLLSCQCKLWCWECETTFCVAQQLALFSLESGKMNSSAAFAAEEGGKSLENEAKIGNREKEEEAHFWQGTHCVCAPCIHSITRQWHSCTIRILSFRIPSLLKRWK